MILEYKLLTKEKYQTYSSTTSKILQLVENEHLLNREELTYKHIIEYFEKYYHIQFVFFQHDPYTTAFPEMGEPDPASLTLKYRGIVNNYSLVYKDQAFCKKCSGMTLHEKEQNKFLIFINQENTRERVIFTILHELCHIYKHFNNHQLALSSFNHVRTVRNYPPELQDVENEANTVASILFLNDDKLVRSLANKVPFKILAKQVSMSHLALKNRLKNYLIYHHDFLPNVAQMIVEDYYNEKGRIFKAIKYHYSKHTKNYLLNNIAN